MAMVRREAAGAAGEMEVAEDSAEAQGAVVVAGVGVAGAKEEAGMAVLREQRNQSSTSLGRRLCSSTSSMRTTNAPTPRSNNIRSKIRSHRNSWDSSRDTCSSSLEPEGRSAASLPVVP